MATSSVPKIIFQTYVNENLPTQAKDCQKLWQKMHSNFQYFFYTDNDIEIFFEEYFDSIFLKTLQKMPLGVMKADFWRYAVLYIYGGIYADIDSIPKQNILNLLNKYDDNIFIGLENDVHFCQWIIISKPQHEIFNIVLNLIVEKIKKGIDYSDEHFVHRLTGPGVWTEAVSLYFKEKQNSSSKIIFNKYCENSEGVRLLPEEAFCSEYVQNFFGSNHFDEPYKSWTKERESLWKKIESKKSFS